MPMVMRDYRQLMLKYLTGLLSALKGLRAVLVNRRAEVQRRLAFLDARYDVPPQEVATTYRLTDLNECRKWADQALEIRSPSGAPYGKGASARIIERILLPGQSDAYYRAAYDVEQEAEARAAETFQGDSLVPDALADKKQPLKGPGRWQWLFSRAQPLGRPRSVGRPSFTIFTLASDAPRMGDSGRPLRENNWLIARSCQPHEIICLRGFVDVA
jgi:hypothetical protein